MCCKGCEPREGGRKRESGVGMGRGRGEGGGKEFTREGERRERERRWASSSVCCRGDMCLPLQPSKICHCHAYKEMKSQSLIFFMSLSLTFSLHPTPSTPRLVAVCGEAILIDLIKSMGKDVLNTFLWGIIACRCVCVCVNSTFVCICDFCVLRKRPRESNCQTETEWIHSW